MSCDKLLDSTTVTNNEVEIYNNESHVQWVKKMISQQVSIVKSWVWTRSWYSRSENSVSV